MSFSVEVFLRLILAAVLGGLIGMERGRHGHAAGLRTHILVCLGSALTTCVGVYTVSELGFVADPLRAAAQVISGIGFLGAGTILVRNRFKITGLTTAAGLWSTAAIGLALGVGFYTAAVLASVLVVVVNVLMPRLEQDVKRQRKIHRIYVELIDITHVNAFLSSLYEKYADVRIHITPSRSGSPGHVGIEVSLAGCEGISLEENCSNLSKGDDVAFVILDD